MNWKRILFCFSLLLGVAALCLIPVIVGVEATLRTIRDAGLPCIAAYFAVCLGSQIFPALGWWILMRAEGIHVSPLTPLKANLMGFPLNFFTPSMYLGSEPMRLFYLARVTGATKRRILATIIVGKFQELASIIFLMILATVYFVWNTDLFPQSESLFIAGTVGAAIFLCAILLAFVTNVQPTVKIINFLARLGVAKRRLARLRTKAKEMEQVVHEACVKRWRTFLLAQFVTLFSAVTIFLRPTVFFLFLPKTEILPLHDVSAIFNITNLVNLITIIPGSLGLYEGGVTGYFDLAGLGKERGLALAVVNRISDVVLLVLGGWMLLHYGLMSFARGQKKEEAEEGDRKKKTARPG